MERRNLHGQPQMPEFERTWNHQPSYPRLNSGTAAFTLHAENLIVHSLNSVQSSNTGERMDAHPLPYCRPDVPNHMSNNIASSYDPFVHPFVSTSHRFPLEYVQHGPYHNQIGAINGSATSNPQMDYDKATRKRKFQATLDVGRGNTGATYYAGSSSNFPSSAEHALMKPMLRPQHSCWDHDHFVPSHRSNNMLPPVGSQGSVRRHYGVHLGTSSALCSSSSMTHDFHSGVNALDPIVAGQWRQNPAPLIAHENLVFSGSGTFNHEMGHPQRMRYVSSGSAGVAETYNFPHRNLMPSPSLTGSLTRGVIIGRGCFNEGTDCTTNVNHPPNGMTVSSGNATMIVPPWYIRPMELVGHYNERNGWERSHYDRLSTSTDEPSARARWVSEELLALGERIGHVSTGLSEDAISKCLTETTYSSDHIPHKEAEHNCVICLEAYKEQEQVGKLNCRHDFHTNCITKWLLIKNACPICKASALTEQ